MNRRKKVDVTFDTFEEVLIALETDYTISLRSACQQLKASRTWVTQFIRPNVSTLYIRSNKRGDDIEGINWVKLARIRLENGMTESIWFHREAFAKFLDSCVYSVTKQTKSVPVVYLMTETNRARYFQQIGKLEKDIEKETSFSKKIKLLKEQDNCYVAYVKKDEETQKLLKNIKTITKRKEVKPVPVNLKYTDIISDNWHTVRDLKGYGDIDETIYRQFFTDGYIRMELHFTDENGVIGKKIFYTKDTNYLEGNGSRIIVAESDWLDYSKKMDISLR